MSVRKTKLCDVTTPHEQCPQLAVGTCCVCDRDLCTGHTTFPKSGGILVHVQGRRESRDGEQIVFSEATAIHICHDCMDKAYAVTADVRALLKGFADQVREAIRAGLAARALAAKGNGDEGD